MRIYFRLLLIYCCFCTYLNGQQSIAVFNGSFEKDIHSAAKTPIGWYAFPDDKTSSPDIHSRYYTYYGVEQTPSDGDRFVSLATRADGSTEGICQFLEDAILSDGKYHLTLDLTRSEIFESRTKDSELVIAFDQPCRLEIWGYNRAQQRDTFLAVTPAIEHTDWKPYKLFLNPEMQINDLCLVASYPVSASGYTYGNILLDNIGPLEQMYNHPALPTDPELLNSKSDEDLAEILRRLKPELRSSGNTSTALKVFLSITDIENILQDQSIQNYIYSTSRPDIFQHIKLMEAIQANNLAAIVKRAFGAYLDPEKASQEDVDFFNSSDAIFKKASEEKSLLLSKMEYLKINRNNFIEEIRSNLY